MYLKVISLLLLSVVIVKSIPFEVCGSPKGDVKSVAVNGCSSMVGDTCYVKKGTSATLSIDFTPSIDVDGLTAVVHGILKGIPLPFNIDDPNACDKAGLVCPLKAGVKVQYSKSFNILSYYPALPVVVKWELKDKSAVDFVCLTVKIKIVD